MKKQIIKLIAVFLLAISTNVFAADEAQNCDEAMISYVGQYLAVGNFWLSGYTPSENPNANDQHNGGVIIAQTCQSSSQRGVAIVAVAFKPKIGDGLDAEYDKHLFVALINFKTRQVVSSYKKVIYGDAVTSVDESSLLFDKVSYRLNRNLRAYGLRIQNSAREPSCGEASWNDELTLFVQHGNKLQPIFVSTMFNQKSLVGCISVQSHNAVWENIFSTINVLNTRTNGYSDLLRFDKVETEGANENTQYPEPRFSYCKLQYDGKKYISQKQCIELQPNL